MKKFILAVILVAAVGGAAYYLLQKKKQNIANNFQQVQILGKWEIDSVTNGKDSVEFFADKPDFNRMNYDYDFRKEGVIIKFLKESLLKDTIQYRWTKDKHLLWKAKDDSAAQPLVITMLNKDSLVLQTKDSTTIYFKKAK